VLTHFDHLGFEAPDGLGHLNAPSASGGSDSIGAIEEILDCGANDFGSDVKRPRRNDCLSGDPSAIGGCARRSTGTFGERTRERRGTACTAQGLSMPKCCYRALVVRLENYRPRVSADFGWLHPMST
jgi:hypothetical protein